MKKKLIFISSNNYDSLLFDKFNLQTFINSTKIETELWKLDFNSNIFKNLNGKGSLCYRCSHYAPPSLILNMKEES